MAFGGSIRDKCMPVLICKRIQNAYAYFAYVACMGIHTLRVDVYPHKVWIFISYVCMHDTHTAHSSEYALDIHRCIRKTYCAYPHEQMLEFASMFICTDM